MSLLHSSFMVSMLTLLGSIISFGNQLVIAHFFGTSVGMDTYLIAASVPFLVSGTLSAVLSYSMVPALISYKSDQTDYGRFAGLIFLSLLGVSVFVFVGGYLIAPGIIGFFGGSLPPEFRDDAVRIARVSWAAAASGILLAYLGTMHNAAKRFYVPIFAGLLPYVGMILFGIATARLLGPIAIAWGMLAGTFLGGLLLLKGTFRELNLSSHCFASWPHVANYFSTIPMIILALACFTAFQTIDAYWAPMIGSGNLSYLGYCQRILVAIGSLVIAGPSVVLVPRLAEAHQEGRQQDFLNDLGRAIRMVLIFAMPIAIMVSILAVPLIELVFQRGAFDVSATRGVVSILPIMMVGMVAMLCVVILFRSLYARQQVRPAALLGTMVLVLYFILSGILSRLLMVQGIALAYAFSWWATLLAALVFVWQGSMPTFLPKKAINFTLQLVGAVILMSAVVYALSALWILPLDKIGYVKLSVRSGIICTAGLATYFFAATKVLMIPEALYVSERLLQGFKGAKA